MQKAPGQSDQGQVDLKRGPWGFGGPACIDIALKLQKFRLDHQKCARKLKQLMHLAKCGGRASAAEGVRQAVPKAPDPAIWAQTRGTPYAGKAFSRAGGAPRMPNTLLGFKGSSWAAKKGAGATPGLAQSLPAHCASVAARTLATCTRHRSAQTCAMAMAGGRDQPVNVVQAAKAGAGASGAASCGSQHLTAPSPGRTP